MTGPDTWGRRLNRACLGAFAWLVASLLCGFGLACGALLSGDPTDRYGLARVLGGVVGALVGALLGASLVATAGRRSSWRAVLVPLLGIAAAVGTKTSPLTVANPGLAGGVAGLAAAALAGVALLREDAPARPGRA